MPVSFPVRACFRPLTIALYLIQLVLYFLYYLVCCLSKILYEHVNVCFHQFQSMVDCSIDPTSPGAVKQKLARVYAERARVDRIKRKFFFAGFAVFTFNGITSLVYFYQYGLIYDNERAPIYEMYTHQMYPRQFWPYGDMIVHNIDAWYAVLFLVLSRSSWLDPKYYIYVVRTGEAGEDETNCRLLVNGKSIKQSLSDRALLL